LFVDINSDCIELHKVPLKQINGEYTDDTIYFPSKDWNLNPEACFNVEFI